MLIVTRSRLSDEILSDKKSCLLGKSLTIPAILLDYLRPLYSGGGTCRRGPDAVWNFPLWTHFIVLIAGLGWGFLALPSCVYTVAAVLPKFKALQDLTKMETSHLLYIVLRSPVIWLAFTFCSFLAVHEFLGSCLWDFLLGIGVALVLVVREYYHGRNQEQMDILKAFKKKILNPLADPTERFPPYSPWQMRLANWRPAEGVLKAYGESSYQCAVCFRNRKFSQSQAVFRGNRGRYIVRCDECGQASIIRVVVSKVYSGYEVITEARMPERRKEEEVIRERSEDTTHRGDPRTGETTRPGDTADLPVSREDMH